VPAQAGQQSRIGGELPHREDNEDEEQGCREEPACPAPPESSEADAAVPVVLAQQETCDQEAGEDEEDVDPEQSTGSPPDPGVEEEDGKNRETPEAVERTDASGCRRPWVARGGPGAGGVVRVSPVGVRFGAPSLTAG